jgi:hypothetical protein
MSFIKRSKKMNVSISIDFSQLKTVISQCNLQEKLELVQLLEKETFSVRFNKFLSSVQTNELSLEDITQEVEAVRQANYQKTQNLPSQETLQELEPAIESFRRGWDDVMKVRTRPIAELWDGIDVKMQITENTPNVSQGAISEILISTF